MRARMVVVVVGGVGKYAIVAATINPRHSRRRRHRRRWLNPIAAVVNNECYCRRRQLPLLLPHSRQRRPPEASGCYSLLTAAMTVIVDGSGGRWQPWQ
jgi:hypothetical protein